MNRKLATMLAGHLEASLLPGDAPFDKADLAEATRFVAQVAARREPGLPAIAIESVPGGIGERMTRIVLVNDNMPFLVDSIAAAVTAHELTIDRLVHPVIAVRRGPDGALEDLPEGEGHPRESIVYMETSRADSRTRVRLRAALESALADVMAAVADWPRLRAAMTEDAGRLADPEGAALLAWLGEDRLAQLGRVLRHRDGRQTGALGICRKSARTLLSATSYARAFAWFDGGGPEKGGQAPLIVKSNLPSQVHRRVPLDLFIVPVVEDGQIAALSVHAGLWTSAALAAPPAQVPRLRASLADLMTRLGYDARGHGGKSLVHALTSLPHDILIGFTPADMERVVTSMMSLLDRPRSRLLLVCAPLERHLYAFVWLPRDNISTALRLKVHALLEEAAEALVIDWSLEVESSDLALIRFVLDIRDCGPRPDEAALNHRFEMLVRGWGEAVEAELAGIEVPARAAAIAARYADAFPQSYRIAYGPAEAACDVARLRRLAGEDGPRRDARLYRMAGDGEGRLRLKLCQAHGALALSDAVPVLENFGFRVIEDVPAELAGGLGTIHDFLLELPAELPAEDLLANGKAIEAAIAQVLNGQAEDDAFNRLIPAIGLTPRKAGWLRAWYRYLRQAGMTFGIPTVVEAMRNAPEVTRGLIALFLAAHDPGYSGDRAGGQDEALETIRAGLAGVAAINDDRLLRAYRALVQAVLRTNAFVPSGLEALACKIDSAQVPGLPRPVPWCEIFVYSPRVEGIHLRAGPVARGGLRWSDRRDDFRTEVLGLMKAQRVKNAVIVPTGAKGGFYPKQLPDPRLDREGWAAEGKASYQVFVRALLSLTDNVVDGRVVHPEGMIVRDGDDPYFVVAADKGTAAFSDTANALAAEKDFWLDDAFASGGSKGYDHKAMGITARGAWLSVQRHFREMGVDVQTDPVRVAGCGDMSGDVFGNGMLLSKAIRLVGAFDHRHIFLDPDPDPELSWQERQRLFALPRSSWDDYDKALISNGGGVFARTLKEIPLSSEVRAMLGIEAENTDPDTLIAAILKAPVDLLWFGGIGTYVKAAAENNVQVGDPANDALRVNGAEIRAKVVGEGANLGCTQAGRIEFALQGNNGAGGRINTDFIDNSAGVDCSDKEVNIKIALASAKRSRRLAEPARVKLLAAMTDDVAELVLEDNRLQALSLSIAQTGRAAGTGAYVHLIDSLEGIGQLDRATAGIAGNEALLRRAADGHGLTRPELAVLLSSTKLALQGALEDSALPDDPGLESELLAAFPEAMRRKFRRDILTHRLRREIVATRLANRMVNRIGMIHPFELTEEEGATLAQVTAAFVAAERLLGMQALWQRVETAAMPEAARILLMRRASAALRTHMADFLRTGGGAAQPSQAAAELEHDVAGLRKSAARLLSDEARIHSLRMRTELVAAGAPEAEAGLVTDLFDMDGAIGLARLARDTSLPVEALARAFIAMGSALGLDWAQITAARMSPSDPWERLLVAGIARDFQQIRLEFLRRSCTRKGDPAAAVARWSEDQKAAIGQFRAMIERAQANVPVAPAMLAQIAGQARNLLSR